MAIAEFGRVSDSRGRNRSDRREARLLFAVAYPFCLAYATGMRLAHRGRPAAGLGKRKSVFGEAKAAASSFVPFAFR